MARFKIAAIIVTYCPEREILLKTINSLYAQVDKTYIVDNTPGGSDVLRAEKFFQRKNNLEIITLNDNFGIAKAQNIGIEKAIKNKTDFVLLSDDDTIYPVDYVIEMIEAWWSIAENNKVAAIVPNFIELNRGDGKYEGFTIFKNIFKLVIHPSKGCHEITQAIASGMFIPTAVFDRVGLLDEKLFIDWVDFEWCWRAHANGYKITRCVDIVIFHRLGDKTKRIGLRKCLIRSPIRHYYIVRNGIHLFLRSKYLNFGMRLNVLCKSIQYVVLYPILGTPHSTHLRYCLRGFFHGIIGKLGKLE